MLVQVGASYLTRSENSVDLLTTQKISFAISLISYCYLYHFKRGASYIYHVDFYILLRLFYLFQSLIGIYTQQTHPPADIVTHRSYVGCIHAHLKTAIAI